MNTSKMTEFYQELGKIFYALAACDKKIHQQEIKSLKNIIRTEWLNVDDAIDEFDTDAAYQIEIIFDWLSEQDWEYQNALDDFKFYYLENKALFSKEIKNLMIYTTNAIANSFASTNKSELVFISKLQQILNT